MHPAAHPAMHAPAELPPQLPGSTYPADACERRVPEAGTVGRTEFERDRARVMHSAALRRLAGKTQVLVPGESDFPRTRLTHSLECGQVGRELGRALGCDPDLVEVACLAHDLGHPPFGHNGEAALDQVAESCGGFEGNAQSFRVLTRLEAKRFDPEGRSAGLNLTRAVLDAATKYPWPRSAGRTKYGVYDDDLDVFAWVRAGAPGERRCLEAQVMDWSDDVAYSVHDLEDAVHGGALHLASLCDAGVRADVAAVAQERFGVEPAVVTAALDRLLALSEWPASYDGSLPALAALKNLTSGLIGRFARAAEQATRTAFGDGPLSRYAADLVVPAEVRAECDALKAIAAREMMIGAGPQERQQRELVLLHFLVERLSAGAPDDLDPTLRPAYHDAADDAARLRVVLDAIASLTDASALALAARLGG